MGGRTSKFIVLVAGMIAAIGVALPDSANAGLYGDNCDVCHGTPAGTTTSKREIRNAGYSRTVLDAALAANMGGFNSGSFSDADRDYFVNYIGSVFAQDQPTGVSVPHNSGGTNITMQNMWANTLYGPVTKGRVDFLSDNRGSVTFSNVANTGDSDSIRATYTPSNGQCGSDTVYFYGANSSNVNKTNQRSFSVDIANPSAPNISSSSGTKAGTFGVSLTYTPQSTGGAVKSYAISSGTLPPGLNLNANSGVISGPPGDAGTYTVTLHARNCFNGNLTGQTSSKSITFNIDKASQSIDFDPQSAKTYSPGGTFQLSGSPSASSGQPLSYASSTMSKCTKAMSGTTVTIVAAGQCKIVASQGGTDDYEPADPVERTIVINPASQTITFGGQTQKTFVPNGTFPLSPVATTTASGLSITYTSETPDVCSVASPTVPTITMLDLGTCTIEASQLGNNNYKPATPKTQNIEITEEPGTPTGLVGYGGNGRITLDFNPPPNAGSITAYNSSCIASPSPPAASSTNSPIVVTGLTNGTSYLCRVFATNPAGNSPQSSAVSVTPTAAFLSVGILNDSAATFYIGKTGSFRIGAKGNPTPTISRTGTLPSGVTWAYNTNLAGTGTLSGTPAAGTVGNYSLSFVATNLFGDSLPQMFTLTIAKGSPVITFPAIADRDFSTTPFAIAATIATPNSILSASNVLFTSSDTSVCTVSGTNVTMVNAGTCTILAKSTQLVSYLTSYNAAQPKSQSFVISPGAQSITFGAQSAKTYAPGTTFDLNPVASASSLLAISYASLSGGVCRKFIGAVPIGTVRFTIVAAGACVIEASQDGSSRYIPATDVVQNVTINKAAQTLNFPAQSPASQAFSPGGTFSVNPLATSSASLEPVYTSLTPAVCSISGSTVSMNAAGTCTIAADQSGNGNYLAANQVSTGITIQPALPGAPTADGIAGVGDARIKIEFTPSGNNGGAAVTNFRATCQPGNITANGAQSPILVSGLTNDVNYTCSVQAQNAAGLGPASNALMATPILDTGANLWNDKCGTCHGATPSAGRFNAAGDTGTVISYVRSVQPTMLSDTAVQELSATELAEIAKYIKTFVPALSPSTNYVTPLVVDVGLPNHLYLGGFSFTDAVVVTPPTNGTLSMFNGTVITYTPNAGFAGTDSFTYRGRRTAPLLVEGDARTVTVTVNAPSAPVITSAATANGVFGELFSFQITASNLPNVFSASGLPPGTLLNTSTGLISGTATAAGSFNTMVSATNPGGTGNLSVVITISATTQTIAFGAQTSPRSFSVGSFAIAPLATGGGSGNPITYSSTTPAVCNVTGITVTVVAAGTCTIAANQAGNTNYNAALPQTQNVTITASAPGAPVLNSATPGDGTATLAFNAPSNTGGTSITLYNATCSPSGVGSSSVSPIVVSSLTNNTQYTCTVTVTNSAGTGPVSNAIMVTPLNTPVPPQFTSANATTFTALVNGNFPVTATGTPSPTLALFSGSLPSGVSFSGGTGSGTLSGIPATGSAASSPYVVTFRASGTAPNADQTFTLTVAKANQTITFANPGPQAFSVSTIPLNVSATSGLSVTLTSDPSSVCTVSGTNLTTVAPGVCSITATQAGNVDVNAANTIINAFSINKANQTITFGAQTTPRNFSTVPFALSPVAFATSALPISYSTTTPSVCVMSGNNVNTLTAGVCTIAANQAGNTNYNAALQVTQSVTVNAIAPDAPTIGTASGSDMQVSIAFTVPASNGGSPITQYTATCNAGNFTGTGSASPVIVSGLTNGMAYTCSVTATNSAGPSNASGTVMVTPTSANGAALWSSVCAACHSQAPSGNQLNGAGSTATVLQHVRVTQTLMAIFPTVQNLTQSDLAAIAIYIRDQLPVNAPTTAQNTPLPINVGGHIHLTNQTWSAFTSVEVVTPPTNGMLSAFTGTTATYTPNNGYSGSDSFTYRGKRTSPDVTGDAVQITITVQPGVPAITSAGSANGTFNTAFSYPITATGTPTSYGATNLPAGFSVDTSTGEITGVPNATGTFNATVSATNTGGTGQAPLTIVIAPAAQVIIFGAQTPATRPYVFGGAFTINPTATGGASGQAVSYGTTTPAVCAVSGVNVDILAAGSCILTANQAGSANYAPASEATQTVTITAVVPDPPLIGAATSGNASAQIAFSAPTNTGGAPITGYTATCLPSGSGTGGTSPITVGGLMNGTTYTCTVRAANSAGQGAASSSVQVTPAATSVPDAPVIGIPIELDGAASIAFSPPANNGGAAITQYTATCNPGGKMGNNAVSPVLVGSLTNGVTYTCTVTATNSIGTGPPSAPVDVTPQSSITFVGAKSQKLHVAMTYDLPIFNVASIDVVPLTVEPRAIGSGHKIVFEFTDAINAVNDAIVTDELGALVIGIATSTDRVGSTVEVSISGLADNRRIGVALFNVNGTGLIAKAYLGFLVGDVTQSKSVNAADIAAIKSRIGQPISTGNNYLFDVNLSGAISGADASQAKARSGLVIP